MELSPEARALEAADNERIAMREKSEAAAKLFGVPSMGRKFETLIFSGDKWERIAAAHAIADEVGRS